MTRHRWIGAFAAFAAALALGVGGYSWWLAGSFVASANRPVVIPADFRAETVSIPGDGHAIAGTWRDLGAESPVVLLVHGMGGSRASMLPRARILIDAGFSVLLIDQQAHGETPGERITLGWLESRDVRAARDWIRAHAPGRRAGVIGVSLGGASVLLGTQPVGFDAVVLEAVHSRLRPAVENRVGPLAPLLLAQIEPRLHVRLADLDPIAGIARLGAPVLVAGGSRDAYTPEQETRELFAAAREPKELWMVDGAAHEDFSRFDPSGYEARVVDFLKRRLRSN